MNYKESKKIWDLVSHANRILVNCHKGPDPDSVGCALAFYEAFTRMKKKVEVFCPTPVTPGLEYLKSFGKIKEVDFAKQDFSQFDLFIVVDSSSWDFATGMKRDTVSDFPAQTVVIDHHKTNENFGAVNIVDPASPSCAEVVYRLFEDWGVNINQEVATTLLTGIIGDTGAFKFPGVNPDTFKIASKLIEKGADKDRIIFHVYFSVPLKDFRFWGYALTNIKFDKELKCVWLAISEETVKKFQGKKEEKSIKDNFATNFLQSFEGTDFGMIMTEEEKGKLNVSFRSRTGLDVSRMAVELGGGGHRYAAGGSVEGFPFEEAVKKVLVVARKYAKGN